MKLIRIVLLLSILIFTDQCNKNIAREPIEQIYSCSDSSDSLYYPNHPVQRDIFSENTKDVNLISRFSLKSLTVANSYGIIPLLKKLIKLEGNTLTNDKGLNSNSELYELRLRLHGALEFAAIDISGSASEMNCYAERMNDFIRQVINKEREVVKNYTLLSIIAAAGFTVISGGVQWQSNTIQSAVNIVAGSLSGYYGYKATTYEAEIKFIPEKRF